MLDFVVLERIVLGDMDSKRFYEMVNLKEGYVEKCRGCYESIC